MFKVILTPVVAQPPSVRDVRNLHHGRRAVRNHAADAGVAVVGRMVPAVRNLLHRVGEGSPVAVAGMPPGAEGRRAGPGAGTVLHRPL